MVLRHENQPLENGSPAAGLHFPYGFGLLQSPQHLKFSAQASVGLTDGVGDFPEDPKAHFLIQPSGTVIAFDKGKLQLAQVPGPGNGKHFLK